MFTNKYNFISSFQNKIMEECGKQLEDASDLEKYKVLVHMITAESAIIGHKTNERFQKDGNRRVYYFSMEFLLGRLLYNYLLNTGELAVVQDGLMELGIDLQQIIVQENDPGLGNGGLGRLAACYLDSMAKENIPGYGYGIFFRYGLFKQEIKDGYQVEETDEWLENGYPWANQRPEKAVKVKFGGRVISYNRDDRITYLWEPGQEVYAVPNEIPIIGYAGNTVNRLSLWSAKPVDDKFDLNAFNNGDYGTASAYRSSIEAISQILYPSDATEAGKLLRLKQEYFMVAAGVADIVRLYKYDHGNDSWGEFPNRIAIHINDTHPALCGAELMRIFMDDFGMQWDEAWDIVIKTISFTNHTILPESLEEWSIDMMRGLLPRIYMIIEEIDRRFREELPHDLDNWQNILSKTAILWNGKVRMANLSVITSYSVNGVSALHSDIIKNDIFLSYNLLMPKKFTNVTNGISHRRYLAEANPELANLISDSIGTEWLSNAERLKELNQFAGDNNFLNKLAQMKKHNKINLAEYIWKECEIKINPDSIFDVQVKRFHAYKRQLLNVLKIMSLYNHMLEKQDLDIAPCTFVFSGKAAQSYSYAKSIIKLINSLADIINNDQRLEEKLKIVFLKNFNVSMAQIIYPAADISEQISTAGMEASGTGNMKFMMNGAITLGTLDGANIEILERVGEDNIGIFGITSEEVQAYRENKNYNAWDECNRNPDLIQVINQLKNDFLSASGTKYWEIYDSLMNNNDYFFILKDFEAYMSEWNNMVNIYKDEKKWYEMSLKNIANSGYFSSDRAIQEYIQNIWKIK